MRKVCLIIVILSLAVILSGCLGGKEAGPKPVITDIELHKGVKGLEIEFREGFPPREVAENETFSILIELQNSGAQDIEKGVLTVGTDEYLKMMGWEGDRIITGRSDSNIINFNLDGKSLALHEGDYETMELRLESGELDPQLEVITSTFILTACYPYRTEMAETICIDTNPTRTEKIEGVCRMTDLSLSSQGAPVALTKVETRMLPAVDETFVKPQFTFHIQNKGNGEVINPEKVFAVCSSARIFREDINRLKIKANLADKELECRLEKGLLRLKEGYDSVKCTLPEGMVKTQYPYTSTIYVTLDYGYTFSVSRDIWIRKD